MSEQITPERRAEAEAISHAACQVMRAEMIEAVNQREGGELDIPLIVEGLEAEAAYQAAREALSSARSARERALYAMWRANKDPRAVAASMPATVKAATVRAAVIKHAPSQDFEALPLWHVDDEDAVRH